MISRLQLAVAKSRAAAIARQKEEEEKELTLIRRVISQLPQAPTLEEIKQHIPQPINKTEVVKEVHTKEIEVSKPLDPESIKQVVDEQLAKMKEMEDNNDRAILPEIKVIREEVDKSDLVTKRDLDDWLKKINNAIMASSGGGGVNQELLARIEDLEMGNLYDKLIDVDGSLTYIGEAEPGVASSEAKWRIKRIDETNTPDTDIRYAEGSSGFVHVWDNRASLTY